MTPSRTTTAASALAAVDGNNARRDFLHYALSLMRAHNNEHSDLLPMLDITALKHVSHYFLSNEVSCWSLPKKRKEKRKRKKKLKEKKTNKKDKDKKRQKRPRKKRERKKRREKGREEKKRKKRQLKKREKKSNGKKKKKERGKIKKRSSERNYIIISGCMTD